MKAGCRRARQPAFPHVIPLYGGHIRSPAGPLMFLPYSASAKIQREVNGLSFLNNLITGISLGSVYAIIALGYTMEIGRASCRERV